MNPILLTTAKKKTYTIPEGEYSGTWQNYFVWIMDEHKKVFARIETKKQTKKKMNVKIKVECTTVKIYG